MDLGRAADDQEIGRALASLCLVDGQHRGSAHAVGNRLGDLAGVSVDRFIYNDGVHGALLGSRDLCL